MTAPRYLSQAETHAALDRLTRELDGETRVALSTAHVIVLAAVPPSPLVLERMRTARLLGQLGWRKVHDRRAPAVPITYERTL